MKKLLEKAFQTFKKFFSWVWGECRDWRTFVLLAAVCLFIGIPVWGGYLLYLLFDWTWAFVTATACLAFWWLPGVPFFAVSVTVTLTIKKIWQSVFKRKRARMEADARLDPAGKDQEASGNDDTTEEK